MGDEMNLHMAQDVESDAELMHLAAVPYQIISPANNKPIIGIFQDSLLGCFRFTRENVRFTAREAMNLLMMFPRVNEEALLELLEKQHGTLTSFDVLSQIMPPLTLQYKTKHFKDSENAATSNNVLEIRNGKYLRGQMDKGVLEAYSKGLLQRVCNDYGNRAASDFIDNLQNIVTEYMKSSAYSVGISDLISDTATKEKIIRSITDKKNQVKTLIDQTQLGIFKNDTGRSNEMEFEQQVNNILNKASSESGKIGLENLSKDNRFVIMVNAGSKGSELNISQMISCLGQQNVDGKRIPYGFENRTLPHFHKFDDSPTARGFVESSYINGLNPQELFFHAMGGRVGLIDTAVKSVTWETPVVVVEDGVPKYTEIGRWIDERLDEQRDRVQQFDVSQRNMELLEVEEGRVFIPTTDADGKVSWGPVTAMTRHDPGTELYKFVTRGGREVIASESKSMLVWDDVKKGFFEKDSPDIHVGDAVPVTMHLSIPPVTTLDIRCQHGIFPLTSQGGYIMGKYIRSKQSGQNNNNDNIDNHLLDEVTGLGHHLPPEVFLAPEIFVKSLLQTLLCYEPFDEPIYRTKRLAEDINLLLTRCGFFAALVELDDDDNGFIHAIQPRDKVAFNWLLQTKSYYVLPSDFQQHNDVVMDPIIEITLLSTEKYPKLYDLTIPTTLNFGLANGLQVRDTSSTGYIQRRLIKGLEDLMVSYDMTVRTNKNKIVQFVYGYDGIDTTKVENQTLPLLGMSVEEIYNHYNLPASGGGGSKKKDSSQTLSLVFDKNTLKRHKKELDKCNEKCQAYTKQMVERRDEIVQHVMKNKNESVVHSPVGFQFIISNVQGQQQLQPSSLVDLTMLEAYAMIEDAYTELERLTYAPPSPLFHTLYFFHLSPKDLLVHKRFHRAALTQLLTTVTLMYKRAMVAPGEMVGLIAGQSLGEKSTQCTLNSVTYETEILVRDREGTITMVQIGDFIEKHIKAPKKLEYYEDKDTTYAEMAEYYEVPSATEDGEVVWKEIEAVTRHPVVNKDGTNTMLRVTTEEEREVVATKAKSFLKLVNGKLVFYEGANLQVGDYMPVSLKPLESKESLFLDLRTILPPTEYVYSSEVAKAEAVMHEHHWWMKHSGKTFTVPHLRSDSLVVKIKERNGYKHPNCVYMLQSNMVDYIIPEKIPLDYNFGYLVGAYAAEGCMTKFQVSISNNDTAYFAPILELCKKWNITTKVFRHENKNQEGWTSQDVRIYNTLLCRILEKLCGKLSHNKFVDTSIVFSNRECILGFLDAYIGGDGCVDTKAKGFTMASVSKTLLMDVQQMLNVVGVYSFIKMPENIHQMYYLFVRNNQAKKLAGMLQMKLPSKQEKLQVLLNTEYSTEYSKTQENVPDEIDDVVIMRYREKDEMKDVYFDKIKKIEEVANTTNYAYDLTVKDTRTFNLRNGLCIVDTFHFAGVSGKSNVTRGVPRIEEILSLSSEPKNPSLTICLRPEDETDKDKAHSILYMIEHTKMQEVVKSVEICFDPRDTSSLIEEDRATLEQFYAFESLMSECTAGGVGEVVTTSSSSSSSSSSAANRQPVASKWILRMTMDMAVMLEKNITMDDVNFALKNSYGNDIQCVFSDYNAERLVFRIRLNQIMQKGGGGGGGGSGGGSGGGGGKTMVGGKKQLNPLDQSDQIYQLKQFQDQLLHNIVLRGIKGIENVTMRKIKDNLIQSEGSYKKQDVWVLDTTGTNMLEVLALDYIDKRRVYSNDIVEVYETLGIEAARQAIYNEITEVIEFDGNLNTHHYQLLCDRMTFTSKMISIFRHGINNDNIGPIAKASFEETPEMFLKAARHAELDTMRGISANIMCGQKGNYGTSAFQVVLNVDELRKLQEAVAGYETMDARAEIDKQLGEAAAAAETDACSMSQLTVENTASQVVPKDWGMTVNRRAGAYNPGF